MIRPKIIAVMAMNLDRTVGLGNKIPWYSKEDFKHFKDITTGGVVIMGRKTFESIGKPLPNRTNVIISNSGYQYPDKSCQTFKTLEEAIDNFSGVERKLFLIGGSQIFSYALDNGFIDGIELTIVTDHTVGDTFLPSFEQQFKVTECKIVLDVNPSLKFLSYSKI